MMSAAQGVRRWIRSDAKFDVDATTKFAENEARARLERRSGVAVVRPFAIVVIDTGQLGS